MQPDFTSTYLGFGVIFALIIAGAIVAYMYNKELNQKAERKASHR